MFGRRRPCPCDGVCVQLFVPVLQCEGETLEQWGSTATGGQHTPRSPLSHSAPYHVWGQFVCPSWGCCSAATGMWEHKALHISLHISFEYCDDENILKYFLKVRRRKIIVIRLLSFFLHLCSQAAPYVTCWWGLCVLSWFWFTCWWGSSPINWTTWTAWDWAKCPCVADRGYTTTECWSRLAGGEEQVSQGLITMM